MDLEETVTIELTRKELGYFYNRMKTNRWYERYFEKGMLPLGSPWQPWMADTLKKLTPYKL